MKTQEWRMMALICMVGFKITENQANDYLNQLVCTSKLSSDLKLLDDIVCCFGDRSGNAKNILHILHIRH